MNSRGLKRRVVSPVPKARFIAVVDGYELPPILSKEATILAVPTLKQSFVPQKLRPLSPINNRTINNGLEGGNGLYKDCLKRMVKQFNRNFGRYKPMEKLSMSSIANKPSSEKRVDSFKIRPTLKRLIMDSSFCNTSKIKGAQHKKRKEKLKKLISEEEIRLMRDQIWSDLEASSSN